MSSDVVAGIWKQDVVDKRNRSCRAFDVEKYPPHQRIRQRMQSRSRPIRNERQHRCPYTKASNRTHPKTAECNGFTNLNKDRTNATYLKKRISSHPTQLRFRPQMTFLNSRETIHD